MAALSVSQQRARATALLDHGHRATPPDASPLLRCLAFFEDYPYRVLVAAALACVAAFTRYAVALHPHSGMGRPPMFGDFEAQRHWMEITVSLPTSEWYHNSTRNDLLYWGLDYPPLTAYVSWLCGIVAHVVYPPMVALTTSRGIETPACKLFMRLSVLVLDVAMYFPAVWILAGRLVAASSSRRRSTQSDSDTRGVAWAAATHAAFVVLMQPGLILIDHGHFQYNSFALALVAWALVAIETGYDVMGGVAFSLALNFKQMTLYYAPAFFAFLLARCIWSLDSSVQSSAQPRCATRFARKLTAMGVAVVVVFAVNFAPFCLTEHGCMAGIKQVLHRVFPFARGLFESKVSNLWHAADVVFKVRRAADAAILVRLSTLATAALFTPSCVGLFTLRPWSTRRLLWGLFATSMSFFLASFQVHEKSILMPLLPAAMLDAAGSPLFAAWFGLMATFSMYPLFALDQLVLPYVVGMVGYAALALTPATMASGAKWERVAVAVSLVGAMLLHAALWAAPASVYERFPDLEAVLISLYACGWFVLSWAYATAKVWNDNSSDATGQKLKTG